MKIRTGFVSNSSASSFVIACRYLSEYQVDLINKQKGARREEKWQIKEIQDSTGDKFLHLETPLDNFDMYNYLIDQVRVDPGTIVYNWKYKPYDEGAIVDEEVLTEALLAAPGSLICREDIFEQMFKTNRAFEHALRSVIKEQDDNPTYFSPSGQNAGKVFSAFVGRRGYDED